MAPTTEQITVALDALTADAADWNHAAADLRRAATIADGLAVPVAAFSFAGSAVAATYDALRVKITGLLHEGVTNFDDMAHALNTTATSYAADEAAHVHQLRSIY